MESIAARPALPMHGILNFDKPVGISSARAVAMVKRLLERGTKIGHAGTLDPFASGLLLLLVGKATKRCEELMDAPKQYEATVKLGAVTATDDPESPETPWPAVTTVSRDRVAEALRNFIGTILQRPPAYSAMKIGGRRAYKLARSGQSVELKPRPVQVYGIELLAFEWPEIRLRIDCGRGTYIRSLARDLGAALEVGGYLTALRRTRIGEFRVENAATLERLATDGPAAHLIF
jgi:tRNA pseudouridine55 synthase